MADRITVNLSPGQVRAIQIRLNQLGDRATEVLEESVKDETDKLEQKIKARCPVRTGKLRDSISVQKVKANKKLVKYRVKQDVKKAKYGKTVEFGTSKRRGKFFMKGTFKNNKDIMEGEIKRDIQRRLGL